MCSVIAIVVHVIALLVLGFGNPWQWIASIMAFITCGILLCVYSKCAYITCSILFLVGVAFDVFALLWMLTW